MVCRDRCGRTWLACRALTSPPSSTFGGGPDHREPSGSLWCNRSGGFSSYYSSMLVCLYGSQLEAAVYRLLSVSLFPTCLQLFCLVPMCATYCTFFNSLLFWTFTVINMWNSTPWSTLISYVYTLSIASALWSALSYDERDNTLHYSSHMYSGENKYLILCRFCRFS